MVDWQNIEEKRKYHREYQKRKRSTKAGQEYNRSNALNYYRKNKKKVNKKQKLYRDTSKKWPEINRRNVSSYYRKNKEKKIKQILNWRKKNMNNPQFVVRRALRSRLSTVLKKIKQKKFAKTNLLLGCSFSFFISYIEKKFKEGMSWDNYPKWHLDHITAVSKFDLTKIEDQKKCFHYSNLQPLWAEENLKKYNK
tara:strand:- start:92 stop:676 length:585 start_codon:yes stop_codon:yes gene_type:complete